MQGVRHAGPSEVRASAPGGSDSIVSETLGPLVRVLGRKSQLGVQEAQPAASKALATAHRRNKGISVCPSPRPRAVGDHKGRAAAVQPKPAFRRFGSIRADHGNPLHLYSLQAVRKPPEWLPNTRTAAMAGVFAQRASRVHLAVDPPADCANSSVALASCDAVLVACPVDAASCSLWPGTDHGRT